MKVLAVTLARGGSKSVPLKNIALVAGKPLISYTIEAAQSASLIDEYIVSTDSLEISSVCKSLGASVPFIRPTSLSLDTSTSVESLQHAVNFMENINKTTYDIVVELMCTNPFKTSADIDQSITMLANSTADSVIGMSPIVEQHPARIKKIVDGYIQDFCVPELSSRRQDLRPLAFIRNGSIYALRRDSLMNDGHRFGGSNSLAYLMEDPKASINIDSPLDLALANLLLSEVAQ